MQPIVEAMPPGSDLAFYFQEFDERGFHHAWHVHPEHEIACVLDGEGTRFVGDHVEPFEAGEVVLLAGQVPHMWQAHGRRAKRSASLVIQFSDDCLGSGFFDHAELRPVRLLLRRAEHGLRFTGAARTRALALMQQMSRQRPTARLGAFLGLLDLLAASRSAVQLSRVPQTLTLRGHDQGRIDRVLRHLNQRYTQSIRQEEAARLAKLTPAAFSRFFRRMTGRHFVAYLHDLRIGHAARALLHSDAPVTQICLASGFDNLSHFNRLFRRLKGCTPTQYRRRAAHLTGVCRR
jgi:AraC-like DNA-binding protein